MIREVTISNGNIQAVAGDGTPGYTGDNGAPLSAELQGPASVFVDSSADIFIADNLNNVIREVTAATMKITTVAGTGAAGAMGDGGLATLAQLDSPTGVWGWIQQAMFSVRTPITMLSAKFWREA